MVHLPTLKLFSLEGRVAIVTGGNRNIGFGLSRGLAGAGARVLIANRDGRAGEAAAARLTAEGWEATAVEADVADAAACRRMAQAALDRWGRIDILVSNPACSIRGAFLDLQPEQFEAVLRGTLASGFHVSQLTARHMVERGGGGKLVFISSVQAEIPYVLCTAYNAAKAGLNHMARTIAAELLPYRINVNVIEPGWIDTPGERAAFGAELLAAQAAQLPWGRLGTADDIGQAAAFLASPAADYITGAVLLVDGGYTLCRAACQSSSFDAAADHRRGPATQP